MPPSIITVDVREDIRRGREPFPRIMATVARLRANEQLRVLAPFEPIPLIKVLALQGFTATVTEIEDGGFATLFVRGTPTVPASDEPS